MAKIIIAFKFCTPKQSLKNVDQFIVKAVCFCKNKTGVVSVLEGRKEKPDVEEGVEASVLAAGNIEERSRHEGLLSGVECGRGPSRRLSEKIGAGE